MIQDSHIQLYYALKQNKPMYLHSEYWADAWFGAEERRVRIKEL